MSKQTPHQKLSKSPHARAMSWSNARETMNSGVTSCFPIYFSFKSEPIFILPQWRHCKGEKEKVNAKHYRAFNVKVLLYANTKLSWLTPSIIIQFSKFVWIFKKIWSIILPYLFYNYTLSLFSKWLLQCLLLLSIFTCLLFVTLLVSPSNSTTAKTWKVKSIVDHWYNMWPET